jgi:hypothetical protein
LNTLEPELLERFAVEFIGRPTPPWPVARVRELLSDDTRRTLRGLSFETTLDQHEALARLRRPGTLALMPSFEENSPNTIYECLENGIPFIAGNVAGIRELVATEDHSRVLCEPTEHGIGEALRRALNGDDALRPARPAFDDAESLRRWEDVLALPPDSFPPSLDRPVVAAVVVRRSSQAAADRCRSALEAQTGADVRVTVAQSRAEALPALDDEWVLFLDEDDLPEPTLVETLVRAQQVSGADVVSCGLFLDDGRGRKGIHLFAGEPRALGLLANGYGTVALLRRSLLGRAVAEPDWPLLAGLSFAGAKIVSVPIPLVTRTAPPAAVHSHPADARLVLRHAERALPHELRLLAELGARLAADLQRPVPPRARGLARRAARRLLAGMGR